MACGMRSIPAEEAAETWPVGSTAAVAFAAADDIRGTERTSETLLKRYLGAASTVVLVAVAAAACGSSTSAKKEADSATSAATQAGTTTQIDTSLSASGVLTGGNSLSSGSSVKKGGVLKIANQSDYDYYDGMSYYGDIWAFEFITCNGLLDYPDTTGKDANTLRPGIAQDMPKVSSDGLTYTFTIRKGVKFSNGAEVTPADVVGTYERMLDPGASFNPLSSGYYNVIEGFDKYTATDKNGKPLATNSKTISGITTSGQDVSFKLTKPDPAFLYATALRFACIVPADSPHKHTTLPPPMTGPYMFSSVQPKKSFKIVRNPVWADNVKAGMIEDPNSNNVDEIDYSIMSPEQMLLNLKNNNLDVNVDGASIAGANANAIGNDPKYKDRFYSFNDASTSYFYFNFNANSPMNNVKLRQAANYAINRSALIKINGGKFIGVPWSQFLSSNLLAPGADTNIYPTTSDLAKAKQLVKDSGVKTPVKVNLYYQTGAPGDDLAQNAAESLKQVGFDVTLKGEDTSVYYTDIQDPKAARDDIGFGAWGQDYGDAGTYFGPLLSSAAANGGSNYGDVQDKSLDAAIDKASLLPIGDSRVKAFSDLSTSMMKDLAPLATFRNRRKSFLVSDRVGNFQYNPTKLNYWGLYYIK
jgi:peptide/nickel transport system substrate-binding protein